MDSPLENKYLLRRLEEAHNFYGSSFSNRYNHYRRRESIFMILRNILNKHKKKINMLDLGCGDGSLIYRIKLMFRPNYNLELFGIDISDFDIEFANQRKKYYEHKNCNFLIMDAENIGFKDNSFDVVISTEVIEHIRNPLKMLCEVKRILKEDGYFILTTPNPRGFFVRSIFQIFKFFIKDKDIPIAEDNELKNIRLSSDTGSTGEGLGHVSVKQLRDWIKILKSRGFKILSVKGTGGILFGSGHLDYHPLIFAVSVFLDIFTKNTFLSKYLSESIIFLTKKQ